MNPKPRTRTRVPAADDLGDVPGIRRRLLAWYDRRARDLPWRASRDPYRVWISEIMLQQTQVETVIPYYRRWLQAFPDVFRLAAAEPDAVLKLWEGLGYYSRARHLHAAARRIAADGGRFPANAAGWLDLPGVGRYTAGAIASIALGEAVPVVDGNVKRVLARFYGYARNADSSAAGRRFWRQAAAWVPAARPGDFNQALMELGALVCRPRQWDCPACPLAADCRAAARGWQARLPVKARRAARPHYAVVAAVIERQGTFLVGRRPPRGLLGGLWEFPGGKLEPGETPEAGLRREIREELGAAVAVGAPIAVVDHAYTHFSITLTAYACRLVRGEPQAREHTELRWVDAAGLARLGFPKADRVILEALANRKKA